MISEGEKFNAHFRQPREREREREREGRLIVFFSLVLRPLHRWRDCDKERERESQRKMERKLDRYREKERERAREERKKMARKERQREKGDTVLSKIELFYAFYIYVSVIQMIFQLYL